MTGTSCRLCWSGLVTQCNYVVITLVCTIPSDDLMLTNSFLHGFKIDCSTSSYVNVVKYFNDFRWFLNVNPHRQVLYKIFSTIALYIIFKDFKRSTFQIHAQLSTLPLHHHHVGVTFQMLFHDYPKVLNVIDLFIWAHLHVCLLSRSRCVFSQRDLSTHAVFCGKTICIWFCWC